MVPSNSVSNLLRNDNVALAELIATSGDSSRLSLLHSGSETNAAFGGVSGRFVVVIHGDAAGIGDTPTVGKGVGVIETADHPAGRLGAVTPSKFWLKLPG